MSDQASVTGLLAALAVGFITVALHKGWRAEERNSQFWVVLVFGVLLLFAAIFWRRAVPGLGGFLGPVAANPWTWVIGLFAVWAYMAATALVALVQRDRYGQIIENDIIPFRRALQMFVLPRRVDEAQQEKIANHLRDHEQMPVTFVIENDTEASAYASDLMQALRMGGWKAITQKRESNLPQGIHISFQHTKATQDAINSRQRENPSDVLRVAFEQAGVFVSGGGGGGPTTEDLLTVSVGRAFRDRLNAQVQKWVF